MIGARTRCLSLLVALALPGAAHAQGGLLKKMKEKAAEAAARKAAEAITKPASDSAQRTSGAASDSATPAASTTSTAVSSAPAAAPAPRSSGGGMSIRRKQPADPTLLESPGYRPPAGAQGVAQATPRDASYDREWHGTPQDLGAFAASIPPLTDAALDAYVRARTAQVAEAQRLRALTKRQQPTRAWLDTVRAEQTRPLANDEKVPYLVAEPWEKPGRSLRGVGGGDFDRRLDAVAERELGGALTRVQYWQVHEMVQKFLSAKQPAGKAQGPGRDLTGAELSALGRHRAALERLRDAAQGL